ncbi:multidrug transporter [Erythrobacter sp. 3-20A1M]|uniref:SapC family protein n=1 Tax=Erythrobacter sp. 3-20A1M TaxID=2653850 RepID=UPI001BFC3F69|nr:SapC family protein [Erythrobacter sp. 3-20A1M]QWC55864.1 multidrug transporter [Erythrobacter sp. 3-20A1M]
MASAPQPNLPLFYKDLMPLNSRDHAQYKTRQTETASWLVGQHAIPLTSDEFVPASRHFPIIFSSGDAPLPLALMGLNEGVNTFVDDSGKVTEPVYIPAYIRRYPFMLARLQPDSEDLSLCFDPTSDLVGEDAGGEAVFDGEGKPTEATQGILEFCQQFEEAGMRTQNFIAALKENDLLIDGEIGIEEASNPGKPFVYRGFQVVDQNKLRELAPERLKEWNENGILQLIYAHLFSVDLMRVIFARQAQQGKKPVMPDAATAELQN